MVMARSLKTKDETKGKLKELIVLMENQTSKKLKRLRCDNGTEFKNEDLMSWFKEKGIKQEFTVEYTPASNGIAERTNRTLLVMMRTTLLDSGLPHTIWDECVQCMAYVHNRCKSMVHGRTPYEIINHKKPTVGHLRRYGCTAYWLTKGQPKNKLDPRGEVGILVGYSLDRAAYRIWNPVTEKIVESRDVTFNERELGITKFRKDNQQKEDQERNDDGKDINEYIVVYEDEEMSSDEIEEENTNEENDEIEDEQGRQTDEEENTENEEREEQQNKQNLPELEEQLRKRRRPTIDEQRVQKEQFQQRRKEQEKELVDGGARRSERIKNKQMTLNVEEVIEPKSYEEAVDSPERKKWIEAMRVERRSIQQHEVYDLTVRPKDKKTIKSKWVYKVKRDNYGGILKYKARLVAVGCSQKPGEDYDETYAPVIRSETIRIMIDIAAKMNVDIESGDVKTAFLHGKLKEVIFMEQPKGFREDGNKVWRLKRSLYGLKQAGRCWYECLAEVLEKIGFRKLKDDTCAYVYKEGDNLMIIGTHVDDVLSVASNQKLKKTIYDKIKEEIDMIWSGKAKVLLGIEIIQKKGEIILRQTRYIEEVLKRFGMENCNTSKSPVDPNQKLDEDDGSEEIERRSYQEMVGSLMYLATQTRPDIAFARSCLSQYNQRPKKIHETAVKRVMRYLNGTKERGLTLGRGNFQVKTVSDASWDRTADAKSFIGTVTMVGESVVNWRSKKLTEVSKSSCESELWAIDEAIEDGKWTQDLLEDIFGRDKIKKGFIHETDSKSAIDLIKSGKPKKKQFNRKCCSIRDMVKNGMVKIQHIPGEEIVADFLTKPLSGPGLERQLSRLKI